MSTSVSSLELRMLMDKIEEGKSGKNVWDVISQLEKDISNKEHNIKWNKQYNEENYQRFLDDIEENKKKLKAYTAMAVENASTRFDPTAIAEAMAQVLPIKDIVSAVTKSIKDMNDRNYCSSEKMDSFRIFLKEILRKGIADDNLDFLDEGPYKLILKKIVKFLIICMDDDWATIIKKEMANDKESRKKPNRDRVIDEILDLLQHEYDVGLSVTKWRELRNNNVRMKGQQS